MSAIGPLEFHLLVERGVALRHQIADALDLALVQGRLIAAAGQHAAIAFDQRLLPLDRLVDRAEVRGQRGAPRLQQLVLRADVLPDQRIGLGGLQQVRVKVDRRKAQLLGDQPAFGRAQSQVALARRLVVGAGDGVVQPDHDLAGLDHLAFAHQHFADDAALQVLDGLALGVHRDHAAVRNALVERREGRPQQEAAEADADGPEPEAGDARRVGGQRFAGRGLASTSMAGRFGASVALFMCDSPVACQAGW